MTRKTFDIRVESYPKNNSKIKIDKIKNVSKILLPNGIEIYSDPYDNINIRVCNRDKNVLYDMMSKLDVKDTKNGIGKN